MNILPELVYTETDEWVKVEGKVATIGISDYAQEQLSDVVYVEIIVAPGDMIHAGQQIATIESVKAAADVNSPVSGKVIEVNENLPSTPELVNKSPFDQAWLIKVEMQAPGELSTLMNSDRYQAYCAERSH